MKGLQNGWARDEGDLLLAHGEMHKARFLKALARLEQLVESQGTASVVFLPRCATSCSALLRGHSSKAGVEVDERGYIRVNDRLETTAADVWAIGECAGSPQFTHVSVDDFRIVMDNLAGARRSTRDRLVPYRLFADPPLAHAGLTEREAQRQGIATRIAKLPMCAMLRTEATDGTQGFMKVLVGANDDNILGFTMLGSEAAT